MKKLSFILPLALILCFMVGCQDKAAMAELEKFRAQAAIEAQNIALVRHMYEELNKGTAADLEKVIVRIIFRGTHQGEFMGIQPIGNKVEVGGLNILRIENGKFIEDWEDSDMLGWMMQPGMELRPKAEK
jgi:predicted ester cyclase